MNSIKRVGFAVVLLLAILVSIAAVYFIAASRQTNIDVHSETEHSPAVCIYGKLYTDNHQVDVGAICRRNGFSLYEVLYVENENAYIVCSANASTQSNSWTIAHIDLSSSTFTPKYHFEDVQSSYIINSSKPHSERNGFYCGDGILVLSDLSNVHSYNVATNTATVQPYHDYSFPSRLVSGRFVSENSIEIRYNEKQQIFSLEDIAENSDAVSEIATLRNSTIWDGKTLKLSNFFNECSVKTVGDMLYAMGSFYNYWGESYAVLLVYDPALNCFHYIDHYLSGDWVSNECYVVCTTS